MPASRVRAARVKSIPSPQLFAAKCFSLWEIASQRTQSDSAAKSASDSMLVARIAVRQLSAATNKIDITCVGPAKDPLIRYAAARAKKASAHRVENAENRNRLPGKLGFMRQRSDNAKGKTGGYFVCHGSSGKLRIEYPCPVAKAFAVTR